MEMLITVFLYLLAGYFLVGLLFGVYFFIGGAKKIDPLIIESKWTVRLLLVPGAIGMWPALITKLIRK